MSSPHTDRRRTAELVWSQVRAFVQANDHNSDIRARLGLGQGNGRIKVMRLLTEGPLNLAELAAKHNVTAPYATIIVDQLEALRFVTRSLDATDKRRKLVALTLEGREAVALASEIDATPPHSLDVLSTDELRLFEALLARVVAARE